MAELMKSMDVIAPSDDAKIAIERCAKIALIERWIVRNVDAFQVVPVDEGNTEALVYNLVQLLRHGDSFKPYTYEPEQDKTVKALYKKYGRHWLD
jgi:hypothetical protein